MLAYVIKNSNICPSWADDWGFTALTYAIKNNFFVGVVYLLANGASLTDDARDINQCTFVHWAAFMDRVSVLQILYRADLNFKAIDKTQNSPWDRAMDNWSLFTLHFMLDYSQRSLKTLWFLKGNINFPEIDMLPDKPKKSFYEVKSYHIPPKMRRQTRIRQGVHSSLSNLFEHSMGYFMPEYVSYNWYKNNIQNKYWLKVYLSLCLILFIHLTALIKPLPDSGEQFPMVYAIIVIIVSSICNYKMIRFGSF